MEKSNGRRPARRRIVRWHKVNAPKPSPDTPVEEYNPYLAFAGIFKDDPFAEEVDAFIQAERQRQREEAARLADEEDAAEAARKAEVNE